MISSKRLTLLQPARQEFQQPRNMDKEVVALRPLGSPVQALGEPRTEVPMLEFVTITGQPSKNQAQKSKQVRIHAMRDYIRKSKGNVAPTVKSIHDNANPSTFKNKFKLETWSRKNKHQLKENPKPRIIRPPDPKRSLEPRGQSLTSESLPGSNATYGNSKFLWKCSLNPLFSIGYGFDPFDTLAFHVGPLSERGLYHYHNSYFMNSVAINPEGNFFMYIREDPALLHSLLYLVTVHHDLQLGISDSQESLYHGGEAFRVISTRLRKKEALTDMTIAAVAMLANKENFDGKFNLSRLHIRGLNQMVNNKGGISALKGLFLRIVTWSDFCFANTWNCRPTFPYQSLYSGRTTPGIAAQSMAMPVSNSRAGMSISQIISLMRILSADLDPHYIATVDRINASATIYDLEYSLLSMNKESQDVPELFYSETLEVLPMKIALHLYLYLVIREIPRLSGGVKKLTLRLRTSLELRVSEWWAASSESQTWLLWTLFIGYISSNGQDQKIWFIRHLAFTANLLGIRNYDVFKRHLERIVWQDTFCGDHSRDVWNVIF
ncbi:hypothetical protein BGZ60DRAFT_393600 [Tricladium varicosporioides]|nr:hypothetical protein BGZ60DRAFT_393600 [Hymenoscyphus varicosporioides]